MKWKLSYLRRALWWLLSCSVVCEITGAVILDTSFAFCEEEDPLFVTVENDGGSASILCGPHPVAIKVNGINVGSPASGGGVDAYETAPVTFVVEGDSGGLCFLRYFSVSETGELSHGLGDGTDDWVRVEITHTNGGDEMGVYFLTAEGEEGAWAVMPKTLQPGETGDWDVWFPAGDYEYYVARADGTSELNLNTLVGENGNVTWWSGLVPHSTDKSAPTGGTGGPSPPGGPGGGSVGPGVADGPGGPLTPGASVDDTLIAVGNRIEQAIWKASKTNDELLAGILAQLQEMEGVGGGGGGGGGGSQYETVEEVEEAVEEAIEDEQAAAAGAPGLELDEAEIGDQTVTPAPLPEWLLDLGPLGEIDLSPQQIYDDQETLILVARGFFVLGILFWLHRSLWELVHGYIQTAALLPQGQASVGVENALPGAVQAKTIALAAAITVILVGGAAVMVGIIDATMASAGGSIASIVASVPSQGFGAGVGFIDQFFPIATVWAALFLRAVANYVIPPVYVTTATAIRFLAA